MARMERVAVWNLMGGGGNRVNTDVFTVGRAGGRGLAA